MRAISQHYAARTGNDHMQQMMRKRYLTRVRPLTRMVPGPSWIQHLAILHFLLPVRSAHAHLGICTPHNAIMHHAPPHLQVLLATVDAVVTQKARSN